jgi:NADH dehydrogenase (ubiquinone) 1 beta subcomplex subunit 9
MSSRQAALSLYRRSLKLALDWSVQRHLWRGQALYIRSLFEKNRDVSDPRLQRVRSCTFFDE